MIRVFIVAAALAACSGRSTDHAALGSVGTLRERAIRVGCVPVEAEYFGANAFSCEKSGANCGCTLKVRADGGGDGGRLSLVRIDVIGCRAGEAEPDLKQLLDPYTQETDRQSTYDFIANARLTRTGEQEKRLGVLQSRAFGSRHIRVQFGAQPESDKPARRTIWIDPVAADSREELVPDTGLQDACALQLSAAGGHGYCDSARGQVAPCELDADTRSRYRQRVALVVSNALTAWREAVRTLIHERQLDTAAMPPETLAQALLGVLPRGSTAEVSPQTASAKRGVSGVEIAAEGAIEWHDRLVGSLESLFDADLAALVVALRAPEEISTAVYIERIRHRLDDVQPASTH